MLFSDKSSLIPFLIVKFLFLSLQEECVARYKLLVELIQKKKMAKS